MRIIISILTIIVAFSSCTYIPENIPLIVYTLDNQTNAIQGLKCTFTRISDNSNIGSTYTDTNGEAVSIIQYDTRIDNKSTAEIRKLYQISIEDVDGTNNLGDFYTTNVSPASTITGVADYWVFMIKK